MAEKHKSEPMPVNDFSDINIIEIIPDSPYPVLCTWISFSRPKSGGPTGCADPPDTETLMTALNV